MQDSSPILRERKRGELSANRKSSFPSPIYPSNFFHPLLLPLLFPFLRGYFSDFSSPPPLLWISVRYAGRGDDEVHDRGETVKSISTEGMSDEEGRGGWIRFERNRFPPRRSFFSARLVRATGKAKLEGDKATGRTFGRRHDWVCIFLHPSCNGGTNFPGLRTGRGARLRGRNSMEDFEECSSFKGWG